MRILIVCGAGASSTFVAKRLERAAREGGFPLSARAGSWGASIASDSDRAAAADADLVLIGPHLSHVLDEAREQLAPARVEVLPEDCLRDLTGAKTLALVSHLT
ncbi:MAG: hypothetical protein LBE05_07250 [Microbacterium sp.]|nr:hypothetical protein [Microbacterium sp.]